MIRVFYKKIKQIFYNSINKVSFYRNNIEIEKGFKIKGILNVSNNGIIKIGKYFKANSGKKFNPIGGDTQINIICKKNAEIIIGNYCGISNATLYAKNSIVIGDYVMIGGGTKIWDNDFHSIKSENRISENDNDINTAPIIIKNYAFIGGSSIILKGVTIGEKSVVAAGSVVTKNVPDNEIWGGNPAKFIRKIHLP